MSIVPIEEIEQDIRDDKVPCPDAIAGLLAQIRERDDLIQRMATYAGGGHRADIAGRLEAIDKVLVAKLDGIGAFLMLLDGHAMSLKSEMQEIKALLAEKHS